MLDLTKISDDDLAELAILVQAEMSRRNPATAAAVQESTQATIWDRKRDLSCRVKALLSGLNPYYNGKERIWTLTVWQGQTGERRVFIEDKSVGGDFSKQRARNKITYYVTGNDETPPGHLDSGFGLAGREGDIVRLMESASKEWDRLVLECNLE